jgi:hypothetical protein
VIATFPQAALEFVHPGDGVEIAFDRLPGRILSGSGQAVVPATGQGQSASERDVDGVDDDPRARALRGGAGTRRHRRPHASGRCTSNVAAVYTERAQAIRIIRQVVIRMTTWLNYVIL